MVTEEDYYKLSDIAYWIDSSKEDAPFQPTVNTILNDKDIKGLSQSYQIIKIEDNQMNGMQAMAVSPIINETVDTSEIIIAYAGTNFSDHEDRMTDVVTVVGGDPNLYVIDGFSLPEKAEGQVASAQEFAIEVHTEYENGKITTTGHSLGEYLGLYIAAENRWNNVGFNGPDPYNILSDEAKEWVDENPGKLANYRNRYDGIGNFGGNTTGSEILVDMEMGILRNPLDFHMLSEWKFDKSGQLIIIENKNNTQGLLLQSEKRLLARVEGLSLLTNKFIKSNGELSSNEEIYLDNSEALIVLNGASRNLKIGLETTIALWQEAIYEAEELWESTIQTAQAIGSELTYLEVLEALAAGGASKKNILYEPVSYYEEKIAKAQQMRSEYDRLISEIKDKMNDLLTTDAALANQIS